MSSVKVSFLNQVFSKYDIDKNGSLDDAELAKGSLNLLGKDDAQSQTAGQLFATFLQGGKDQKGLFPDFDNDNAVSKAELAKLAAASGNTGAIESSDFLSVFGDDVASLGTDVNIDGLAQIAKGNSSKFNQDSPGFEDSVNSLVPGGNYAIGGQYPSTGQGQGYYPPQNNYPQQGYPTNSLQGMMQAMIGMFQQFMTMFQQQFG